MAKGKIGKVTALDNKWPAMKQPLANAAIKEGKLGKDSTNKELYDSLTKVIKAAVADLYNTPQTDQRLASLVRTIVSYVKGAVQQELDSNTSIKSIADSISKNSISSVVEKAVEDAAKKKLLSKDQTNKLSKAVAEAVVKAIESSKEKEKHDKLLSDIKSMLSQQSGSTTTKTTKVVKTKSAATSLKSIDNILKKMMNICNQMSKLQIDISKTTDKILKKVDTTQAISNNIKTKYEQTAKLQQQLQATVNEGFNNINENIEKVNQAVEEANENIKDMQSGSMLSSMFSGTVGLAFKALGFIGKILFAPIKFIFKWILKPIFGFVGGAIGGLLKGVGSLIAAPFKLLMKGIGKVLDVVTNTAAKTLGTFFMTPAGMYTLGFIGGFIWEMWLKDIIKSFNFSDISNITSRLTNIAEKISKLLPEIENAINNLKIAYMAFLKHFNPNEYWRIKNEEQKRINDKAIATMLDNAAVNLRQIKDKNSPTGYRKRTLLEKADYWWNTVLEPNWQKINPVLAQIQKLSDEHSLLGKYHDGEFEHLLEESTYELRQLLARLGIDTSMLENEDVERYAKDISTLIENNKENKVALKSVLSQYIPALIQHLQLTKMYRAINDVNDPLYQQAFNANQAIFNKLQELKNTKYADQQEKLSEYHKQLEDSEQAKNVVSDNAFHYPMYTPEQIGSTVSNKEIENKVDNVIQKIENVQTDLSTLAEKTQDLPEDYSAYSGWTFIDGKWHYDGVEATKEQNDAVKTEVEEAKRRRAASELPNIRLNTSRDVPKIAQDDFNNLANAALEAGIPPAIVDAKNSEALAKNIATYLSDAQQQINVMPADEQRTWQSRLMDVVMKINDAVNKGSNQHNNHLIISQPRPSQSLWEADKTIQ